MNESIVKIAEQIPGARYFYHKIRQLEAKLRYAGSNYICPICQKSFSRFRDAGINQTTLIQKQVIGAGVRKNAACPHCFSLERQRLEFLYLNEHTDIFKVTGGGEKYKVLHFAPESSLENVLKKSPTVNYYSGDLNKNRAMYKVDITNICFGDSEFDYVICNHVLEHIPDEVKALSEIKRVLKHKGEVIITIPVSPILETTLEEPTTTPEERLALYGQYDHVRLYGLDFSERLSKAGFEVKTFETNTNVLPQNVTKYALLSNETIYIGKVDKTRGNQKSSLVFSDT